MLSYAELLARRKHGVLLPASYVTFYLAPALLHRQQALMVTYLSVSLMADNTQPCNNNCCYDDKGVIQLLSHYGFTHYKVQRMDSV
jgi:hypothetical protein